VLAERGVARMIDLISDWLPYSWLTTWSGFLAGSISSTVFSFLCCSSRWPALSNN